jgi:energy-coupling factor transport system substrate-specific component
MRNKNKLGIKDLITVGIYTGIYFFIVGISAMIISFMIPGYSYIFIPVLAALLSGSVFMLMVSKVPRFGAITIMGSIMGLWFLVMGRSIGSLLLSVVIALIADGIAYLFKYSSEKGLLLSYVIFSFSSIGPVVPMFLFPTIYADKLLANGKDVNYVINAFSDFTQYTFVFLIIGIIIAAILGGIFGQRMLVKHFKKAGIV